MTHRYTRRIVCKHGRVIILTHAPIGTSSQLRAHGRPRRGSCRCGTCYAGVGAGARERPMHYPPGHGVGAAHSCRPREHDVRPFIVEWLTDPPRASGSPCRRRCAPSVRRHTDTRCAAESLRRMGPSGNLTRTRRDCVPDATCPVCPDHATLRRDASPPWPARRHWCFDDARRSHERWRQSVRCRALPRASGCPPASRRVYAVGGASDSGARLVCSAVGGPPVPAGAVRIAPHAVGHCTAHMTRLAEGRCARLPGYRFASSAPAAATRPAPRARRSASPGQGIARLSCPPPTRSRAC